MGSLLPGWDKEPSKPPMGIGEELHEEKRLSLEKDSVHMKRDSFEAALAPEPPLLSRKSAPSSFVIRRLQETFPDSSGGTLTALLDYEEGQPEDEDDSPKISALYSRDKWWRKFSSAHLNELAEEVEKEGGQHTYKPQFDLAGGDQYLKHQKMRVA